jgi:Glycosyltransferases involved in cell wall biogenesis
MSEPFFSIILATFNRAHLLPRAIASVLRQEFGDWELWLVDDGSTDGTGELLREFCSREARIRSLHNPHQGLAKTRNSALDQVRGTYTTFIDSDDEYLEQHLSLHHDYVKKNPGVDMLHGKVLVVGDPYVPDARDLNQDIAIEECTQPGTFFFKTALLKKLGGFPELSFGEDSALLRKTVETGHQVALSPFRTYRYYNTEPDSMCNQVKAKRKQGLSAPK